VLRVASALPEFACSVDDLDADPWLFNVANGTLDLRTMELRDHDPADRITKVARAAYDGNSPGDVFPRFITQVLPDEQVRGYLQRVTGVSLLGKVAEHILPILTGTGANGKGTWYSAMLWAFGDYGGPADPVSSTPATAHTQPGRWNYSAAE
jgi:putative DNA primase/helicase